MSGRGPEPGDMPALVGVTVVGAVLLMAGALLWVAAAVMGLPGPGGLPHPAGVAEALMAGGLACGAVVVALGARPARTAGRRSGRPR